MDLRSPILVALVLSGCAPEPTPFRVTADVQDLMVSVVEPAAEVYWDAVGTVIDLDGVHEFAPATPDEWLAVRNAAVVVAESGNLLMMKNRARDRGEWYAMSRAMLDAAGEAVRAAEARSPEAVFDAGAVLYETCSACHAAYAIETLRPNDERGN